MGCGLPSKTFKRKSSQDEEGDTSLQEQYISSPLKLGRDPNASTSKDGPFDYNVKGTAYKITVALISTPERSITSN
ncbi:unnamed protein product [Blepharisma stoltei]|uniref:Uncharacterized protein n=1 Tax=Blepharisma stoltei TaxID=1481888 RepID=A0AAU9J9K8_9CILI|nr:unnamed protein product [Blepharisma stoltei]